MNIITVDSLVKSYKKSPKPAVDNISFTVEEGSFFSLLGPNGAGKTTTISILTTTLAKTSGTVTIAGYDLDGDEHDIRRSIGVIFQNPSLDMNLTAEENVRIHSILYGLYPFRPTYSLMSPKYKRRVSELAEVLGISEDLHKPIKTFSGGMKRKLEIIRSLTHSPKVLFLDEPTTGLDPLSRKNLWEYLQQVRKTEKTTIFLTTHYLEEAEESDYICIMGGGRIVAQGTPADIKKRLIDEYLTVEVEDDDALAKELATAKLKFDKLELSGKTSKAKARFKIYLGKKTAQEIIRSIKTPLSRLSVHTPTLEEAYVEIVTEADAKRAQEDATSKES